jgi:hypothetical protein
MKSTSPPNSGRFYVHLRFEAFHKADVYLECRNSDHHRDREAFEESLKELNCSKISRLVQEALVFFPPIQEHGHSERFESFQLSLGFAKGPLILPTRNEHATQGHDHQGFHLPPSFWMR